MKEFRWRQYMASTVELFFGFGHSCCLQRVIDNSMLLPI